MDRPDLIYIHPSASAERRLGVAGRQPFLYVPAGVFGLLNEVRIGGFGVVAINEGLELELDPHFSIKEWIRHHPARCYCVDAHWHEHVYGACAVARIVKECHPSSVVVAGGMTASFFGKELLSVCRAIDVVVDGYGEGQLLRVLKEKGRQTRRVMKSSGTPELDSADFVSRDFLIHRDEYLQCTVSKWLPERRETVYWLKTGVGCAFDCAACGGGRSAQKRLFGAAAPILRAPSRVARDIVRLHGEGLWSVALTHDPAAAPQAHWRCLHQEIRDAGVRPGVYIESMQLPDSEYLEDFARTFSLERSTIAITPHTYSEMVRVANGKLFTNSQLWACMEALNRHGIRFGVYFTAGLPFGQGLDQGALESFQAEIRRRFSPIAIFNTQITVDPASPMYLKPEAFGVSVRLHGCNRYISRARRRAQEQQFDHAGYAWRA